MIRYEQNLVLLNSCYDHLEQLCKIAKDYPQYEPIVKYTETGPRLLTIHFSGVSPDHTQWYRFPRPYIDVSSVLRFAQIDDFGNLCWVERDAYQWDGYFSYLIEDLAVEGLEYGQPYPYVLFTPTCH